MIFAISLGGIASALNTRIGNQLRGSVRASVRVLFSAASHPRRIRRQRFPNIRSGDSELSSNLRWLDPCLERKVRATGADSLPASARIRTVDLPTSSFPFGANRVEQPVEFLVPKLTDSLLQICWEDERKGWSCRGGGSYDGQRG
jgi:hypothetical protein